MSDRKRLLNELRVIDLRAELEKRNLDKSGVRGVLIQRLSKYLEDEGQDPSTFKFDLNITEQKTPSKKTRRSESTVEQESEETPAMEDMIVQDDAGDEEVEHQQQAADDKPAAEEKMETDNDKVTRKRDLKDDSEATEAKKPCMEKDIKNEEDHKTENNTDAEDSINLDLGDDELLNEETDNTAKVKKGEDFINYQQRSVKNEEKLSPVVEDGGEAELVAPGERPALALLTNGTDVDDAANEDTTPTVSDDTAVADTAPDSETVPADNQQVTTEAPATSTEGEKTDKEQKDDKDKESDDKKEKKDENKEGGARNLWVSGLSGDTRAKDLKQLCSKHGKVIGAKVVTNARTPGSRCYGYVTMASPQDAENCIKNLHRTELHGRMISVEKAKSESESSARRQLSTRVERRLSKEERNVETKENEEGNDAADKGDQLPKKDDEVSGAESARSTSRTREKSHRSDMKDRPRRSTKSRERRRSPREVLSFSKIWKERDVARARERSRAAREEERRRRAAEDALRERERRQRQEKHRLALEREKLRAEREKIEREKNELYRLERERHRLEREKLELERLELKRAQLRLEEERRKRGYESSAAYRKPAASPPPEPAYDRERHKRLPQPPMSSSRAQFEAPPPPRFEMTANYDRGTDKRDRERDYKREYPRHVASSNMKYPSNGSTNDDTRQPIPGARKEPTRTYESRDSRSYRPSPPGKPEPRNWNASSRYPDAPPPSKGSAGGGGSGGDAWTGSEARYGGGTYEPRYAPAYQPPPPGASYPDRYAPPARDYPRKY